MSILLTIIAFVIVFGLLVLVHELGHFYAAKSMGVKVDEFGFGLPPRAWGVKRGETIYSLNWIPFGGFVRLYGEDDMSGKTAKHPRSFASKSAGKRAWILSAGVIMNFCLAIVLLTAGFSFGMTPFPGSPEFDELSHEKGIVINKLMEDSAALGILEKGDVVVRAAGADIFEATAFVSIIEKNALNDLALTVEREETRVDLVVQPNKDGKLGIEVATIADVDELKLPVHKAFILSVRETVRLSWFTLKALGGVVVSLVSKLAVPEGVAGPVGIVQMTHHVLQIGIIPLMKFTALLSISLGVLNIVPFPALDGGRLLFVVIEVIRRKKSDARVEGYVHGVGLLLLMLLIVAVTWADIMRLFTG